MLMLASPSPAQGKKENRKERRIEAQRPSRSSTKKKSTSARRALLWAPWNNLDPEGVPSFVAESGSDPSRCRSPRRRPRTSAGSTACLDRTALLC